jgi:hypothetical protein
MTGGEVPRPDVESPLLSRARSSPPFLLTGPPGSGKTSLLLSLRDALSREGFQPVYLDLMAAASSPDRFVRAALDVLPAEPFSKHLPEAMCIRQIADSGRIHGVEAVRALFSLWGALAHAHGRPVVLLLDEVTEIRSLAYFSGLREVHEMLGAALQARSGGTVLATSFPTRARRYWPAWSTLEARPLEERDVAGLGRSAAGAVRAGFGWPRYVRVLRDRLRQGDDLLAAWTEEMSTGGRLETACRQTYESLLLRSRGYGISKAVLQAVAHEEGSNLSSLVTRLGRTPGATTCNGSWPWTRCGSSGSATSTSTGCSARGCACTRAAGRPPKPRSRPPRAPPWRARSDAPSPPGRRRVPPTSPSRRSPRGATA